MELSNNYTMEDYRTILADRMAEKLVEINPDKETSRQLIVEELRPLINEEEVNSVEMMQFKVEEADQLINQVIDEYFSDVSSQLLTAR